MPATPYDIEDMEQGSTFQLDITVTDPNTKLPMDLSTYTARSQARAAYTDAEPAFTFTCSAPSDQGRVILTLTDEATAAIPKGVYVYDVELVAANGNVYKVIKGKIRVTPEATK